MTETMLTALHLGNFKAFAETQRIPLCPLTLIFGANSSGKSSILHGLLLGHHALETGELDTYRTTIGGDSVDLGGFRQYIHRREAEQRQLVWGVELDITNISTGERLAKLLAPAQHLRLMLTIGMEQAAPDQAVSMFGPLITQYDVVVDEMVLLQASRHRDGTLRFDTVRHDHPLLYTVLEAMIEMSTTHPTPTPKDYTELAEAVRNLVPRLVLQMGKFLPSGLKHDEHYLSHEVQMLLFPMRTGKRQDDLTRAVRLFLPRILHDLIQGINEAVAATFNRLSYLGPLRAYPPRAAAFAQHYDPSWGAGGGYIWDILRREDQAREAVNRWLTNPDRLKTPYELKVRELISLHDLTDLVSEPLQRAASGHDPQHTARDIVEYIAHTAVNRLDELILVDRRSNTAVSHRDIGFGISQVLPMLVSAFASTRALVAIEQPEIHLHPALQAELGDVFIESALGERRNLFVLETHSEHLILRLMRRMRDTVRGTLPEGLPAVTPDDIAILYVHPGSDESAAVVQKLELDADGELLDPWPGGFFEEGFHERFG